ncbi:myosin alkali light chain [Saccoglossus kowalevskii]|uniref:Myosin alkali light chain n=1 Tax=Saccoglossus kowalevskii TaxID=10224 RepID=D1LX68_SACKO|nr:myosin alkali light chain [Saccoglossus kowalevskii]ACY92574.1 myosin alkali light chain [Saccoglossus kowalevskii]
MSLSNEEIEEAKDTFSLFDRKGDNKAACSQIGDILRSMNLNPTIAEVKKLTEGKGADHRFSFEEFLPMYQSSVKCKDQGEFEDYMEVLKVFDKEGNGLISGAELRHVMGTLGERMSDDEIEAVLVGFEDGDGNVNYEDWVKHIMTLPTYN